ncbi:MAG: NUDIX domain-containing protein [Hyphomicrobiales bacterium]
MAESIREGSCVILVDRTGRVLLQQRDDPQPPEGYGRWAIPGGSREGSESPRETAIREFEEETGVRLERVRSFCTYDHPHAPGADRHLLHVFFADDDVDEAAIDVREGLAFRYWSPPDARSLRMNPRTREMLDDFLASDQYRGLAALKRPNRVGVAVLELDRWGRVLLQLRDDDLPPERYPGQWSIAGGIMEPGEAPDACALREFEEETGHLLEELRLYRVFRRDEVPTADVDVQHVYYIDADIPEEHIQVNEGQAFRYFGPADIDALDMPEHARIILRLFFESPAYKAMFH